MKRGGDRECKKENTNAMIGDHEGIRLDPQSGMGHSKRIDKVEKC
jgi:hypothetical protein